MYTVIYTGMALLWAKYQDGSKKIPIQYRAAISDTDKTFSQKQNERTCWDGRGLQTKYILVLAL